MNNSSSKPNKIQTFMIVTIFSMAAYFYLAHLLETLFPRLSLLAGIPSSDLIALSTALHFLVLPVMAIFAAVVQKNLIIDALAYRRQGK